MTIKLFPHQEKGIEFLKKKKKAILADQMGLGKTKQAIIAAGEDADHSILIVCPASLKINWEREIKMVYPEDNTTIVSGSSLWSEDPWIIINYDILEKNKSWILKMVETGEIDCIVFDEAHYIKGSSIRTKAALEIAEDCPRVYALTGTPLLNRPIELYNLLRAIKHPLTTIKGARTNYSKRYCGGYLLQLGRFRSFWDETGATNLTELRIHLKSHMLRRKKDDVLDLPAKIIGVRDCEMSAEDRKKYENSWDDYMRFVIENPADKDIDNILMARHLVEIQKFKQICSLSKTDRIVADIAEAVEQENKVIVFSQYTETIETIMTKLREKKIGCVQLTGQDDMTTRQKAVDSFQRNDWIKVFVANIKAGGVGITLTAASIVMFTDMEWSPEIHNQAADRAHRIGQTGTVNVYYYVTSDTIDEDIAEILMSKKDIINEVIDGKKDRVTSTNITREFFARLGKKLST